MQFYPGNIITIAVTPPRSDQSQACMLMSFQRTAFSGENAAPPRSRSLSQTTVSCMLTGGSAERQTRRWRYVACECLLRIVDALLDPALCGSAGLTWTADDPGARSPNDRSDSAHRKPTIPTIVQFSVKCLHTFLYFMLWCCFISCRYKTRFE